MTVLGTGKDEAGSRLARGDDVVGAPIDVVVVLKPAHWPCDCPSTQLGPWERVGAGELPKQCRSPPTLTRLMSDALCDVLDWMCRSWVAGPWTNDTW
jgi:hypothetical protein